MRRVGVGLLVTLLVLLSAFALTFLPQPLPISQEPLGPLPKAAPPADMTLSLLPTGAMHARAAFAYRGGSFGDTRDFIMNVALVHHPRGDLLIDAGFGRAVDEHFRSTTPWLVRGVSSYTKGVPVADQLAASGYPVERLAGVVLTHAHWDHVSGLPDLGKVPVWMNADERAFVASGAPMGSLMRSFSGLTIAEYAWDGAAYLGFAHSHDFWGDGSVVLVPASGHTPGSIIVFVNLPSGARYAFVGDLVWQREGIEIPAERPWGARVAVDEYPALVRDNISRMAHVHTEFPAIAWSSRDTIGRRRRLSSGAEGPRRSPRGAHGRNARLMRAWKKSVSCRAGEPWWPASRAPRDHRTFT
jgi:glyoxylase-like metal-dependent hydrolase (beta-lactamase superfamily II)